MDATTLLIVATGIVTYMGFENHSLFEKYKFSVSGIQSGEYYRLVTSAFLHADWNHFIFNMFTLYFFGSSIVRNFGFKWFFVIYFAGVIAGNYISYYFHKKDLWYAAIGASAGVNAVLFAVITVDPLGWVLLFFIIPIPTIVFAVGYLWYTSKNSMDAMSRIGHEAHFGGAAIGVALAIVLKPEDSLYSHPVMTVILVIALIASYLYMQKKL